MKIDLNLAGAYPHRPDYATFVATLRAIQAATPTAASGAPLAARAATGTSTATFGGADHETAQAAWRHGSFHRCALNTGPK